MTQKSGSILLEVLIATMIGAFILSSLFSILSQVNSSVTRIEKISSIGMREFLLQNQLERDLSGAFIVFERKIKEGEKGGDAKSGAGDAADKAGAGDKGKGKKEEYENVPLKKAFYSKNSGENIEILSFVTSNPLKTFGKPTSLMARVVYKLVKDKEKAKNEKISFRLFRQESCDHLDFGVFEKSVPKSTNFEVIKNIKKLSVEYTVTIKPDKDKKDGAGKTGESQESGKSQDQQKTQDGKKEGEQAKEEKVQYKTFKNWTENEIKSTKRERPDFCKFVIDLWDDQKKTYKTFEFKIYIYQQEQKPEQDKPVQQMQSGNQQGQAGLFGQQGQQGQTGSNINLDVILGKNKPHNNLQAGGPAGANNNGVNKSGTKRRKSIFDAFLTGNK